MRRGTLPDPAETKPGFSLFFKQVPPCCLGSGSPSLKSFELMVFMRWQVFICMHVVVLADQER